MYLVAERKSLLYGLFATPFKPDDDDIIRMGVHRSPAAEAVLATLGDAKLSMLPKPTREMVTRALKRIQAASDSTVQLIGPEISIPIR